MPCTTQAKWSGTSLPKRSLADTLAYLASNGEPSPLRGGNWTGPWFPQLVLSLSTAKGSDLWTLALKVLLGDLQDTHRISKFFFWGWNQRAHDLFVSRGPFTLPQTNMGASPSLTSNKMELSLPKPWADSPR